MVTFTSICCGVLIVTSRLKLHLGGEMLENRKEMAVNELEMTKRQMVLPTIATLNTFLHLFEVT